ncbi:MAG: elongation factor 1-beta [Halobacteriota archaeon]|nr:elongation factor 1-beta [Halobacteriota archaeon]
MGEVAAKIRIMPKGVETDLEDLKSKLEGSLPEDVALRGFAEEPIAFGLKAIISVVIISDAEGGTQAVEDAFSKVDGVESIQVVEVGRML